MGLLLWLVFGACVGGVAKWMMPGRLPDGWLITIGLGVVGSFAGGLPFGGNPAGWIASVVGACACLFAYSIWSQDR